MQAVPADIAAVGADFFGIRVGAVQGNGYKLTVKAADQTGSIASGQLLVQVLQREREARVILDASAELRHAGQLPRAKEHVVVFTLTRPAQWPVMPDRPDVHPDDKAVGIAEREYLVLTRST